MSIYSVYFFTYQKTLFRTLLGLAFKIVESYSASLRTYFFFQEQLPLAASLSPLSQLQSARGYLLKRCS